MSSQAALRALDADIAGALKGSGLADDGFYTAPLANFDVACEVYLNREVQVLGEFGQVVGRRDEMRILKGDGFELKQNGRVFIEFTPDSGIGETWSLEKNIGDDGSLSHWVVRRV